MKLPIKLQKDLHKFDRQDDITFAELKQSIMKIIKNTITSNLPHVEDDFDKRSPYFINCVRKMQMDDIPEIQNKLNNLDLGDCKDYYTSKTEKLLDLIFTGNYETIDIPGCGFHYINYKDCILLEFLYREFCLVPYDDNYYNNKEYEIYENTRDYFMEYLESLLLETMKKIDHNLIINEILEYWDID